MKTDFAPPIALKKQSQEKGILVDHSKFHAPVYIQKFSHMWLQGDHKCDLKFLEYATSLLMVCPRKSERTLNFLLQKVLPEELEPKNLIPHPLI